MSPDTSEHKVFPDTEDFVGDLLREACESNDDVLMISEKIQEHTPTTLRDWIESFTLSGALLYEIEELGYRLRSTVYGQKLYVHPQGIFPVLRVFPGPVQVVRGITIKVESLSVFRYLSGFYGEIDGTPGSGYSRILLSDKGGVLLFAAEKNSDAWMPEDLETGEIQELLDARNLIVQRRRLFDPDENAWHSTERLIDRVLGLVGKDRCASLFLENERRFWEARNSPAKYMKSQQDKLGLGWGNHDHHTFRCRRRHFHSFIRLLKTMGFEYRNKILVRSSPEPGWGVLIMDHPGTGAVISADVDILPEEFEADFGNDELNDLEGFGPVGLWTALHGESILEAGMHHLGARYNYTALKEQLARVNIDIMEPFTDLPYFKQAYVHGERWFVTRMRLENLRKFPSIGEEDLNNIAANGVLGSFLECTHRAEGYRGFKTG